MEQENILDQIICKEQTEIIKINDKINEMKKKILELKEELELVTGHVVKFTRKGKIDMRSVKLNTDQQKAFDIIQKRKLEERKLKRANEFHDMIKNCLTQIANERNVKNEVKVIQTKNEPINYIRW